MLRKLLITGLALIMIIAIGASFYNVYAGRSERSKSSTLDNNETQGLSVERKTASADQFEATSGWSTESEQGSWNLQSGQSDPDFTETNDLSVQSQELYDQPTGQGNRYGRGGSRGNGATTQNSGAEAQPQNGLQEWVVIHGVVGAYSPPELTLTTSDGTVVIVQLSNLNYLENIGLFIQTGDSVTVNGFYDLDGGFTVGQITLDTTGQTYNLRDESGRPLWAGGPNRG